MNALQPIYTEINDCRDCYKCVRWCPVKAIKVENDRASILPDDCIFCGRCVQICPSEAKKVRNDLPKTQVFVQNYENVIASIAPSYVAEWPGVTPNQFLNALKKLGFSKISETAIGAEFVSKACQEYISNSDKKLHISTACPVIVELIHKYYPQLTGALTPFLSPMLSHGKFLKEQNLIETKVVFIGPCIAKKTEADKFPSYVDSVITFNDLRTWFEQEGIDPALENDDTPLDFFPAKANTAALYPIDGGMINSMKANTSMVDYHYLTYSGLGHIKKVLNGIHDQSLQKPLFLELLACESGCINGPCTHEQSSVAIKRLQIIESHHQQKPKEFTLISPEISSDYLKTIQKIEPEFNESEIIDVLGTIGKKTVNDELNCGGCGYNSCREFARAILQNKAEQNMCVSYMKRVAQDKASALLQKMPSGVIMINAKMQVIELNLSFAQMMGEELINIYEVNPGLSGADVKKLVPFHKLFSSVLQSGEDYLEKDIRIEGKMFHASIFSIQKHAIVCGLFRDMFAPEVQKEEVVNRTRKVIKENLATVQQIAFLLGENASKTEAILNSIVDSYNMELEE
jgi:iron only hydrogenase large subunit-like protein